MGGLLRGGYEMDYSKYKQVEDAFAQGTEDVKRSLFEFGTEYISNLYGQLRAFPHDNVGDNATTLVSLFVGVAGLIWVYKHVIGFFLKRLL